jgi:hypothetical protein
MTTDDRIRPKDSLLRTAIRLDATGVGRLYALFFGVLQLVGLRRLG